jgi:hypothetical protein
MLTFMSTIYVLIGSFYLLARIAKADQATRIDVVVCYHPENRAAHNHSDESLKTRKGRSLSPTA